MMRTFAKAVVLTALLCACVKQTRISPWARYASTKPGSRMIWLKST